MAFTPVNLPTTGTNPKAGELNNWNTEINRALGEVADRANHSGTQSGTTLTDGSVATAKLADGAATTAKLADAGVTTAKIADGAATTAKIADLGVTEGKLASSAVTSGKIADGAVSTAKVANAAITTAKITDANVTTAKVADSAITEAKVADSAVTEGKIGTAAVTVNKIGTAAVTNAKLAQMAEATFKGRQAGAGTGVAQDLTAAQAATAIGLDDVEVIALGAAPSVAAAYYDASTPGPREATDEDAITISSTTPYWLDAGSANRPIRVTTANAWLNARHVPIGARAHLIDLTSGASCRVWCGPDGTWRGTAEKTMLLAASGVYRIMRTAQNAYICETVSGTAASGVSFAVPVHTRTVLMIGQSNPNRLIEHAGLYGLQQHLPGTYWINAAVGGSSVVDDWWNLGTTAPRANATAAMTAVNAAVAISQPLPGAIVQWIGETELALLGVSLTAEDAYQAREEMIAWFRAEIGDAFLPVVIVPIGIRDGAAGGSDAQYSMMRYIDMVLAGNDANIHVGPAVYDASQRHEDRHPDYYGQMVTGFRLGAQLDNILNADTNDLGPECAVITELSAGLEYRISIDQGDYTINRPTIDLQGFGVYAAGDNPLDDDPLEITGFGLAYSAPYWNVTLTLSAASAGGTVVYPIGRGGAGGDVSDMRTRRFIHQVAPNQGSTNLQNFLPLRPFVGLAGTPPAQPAPLA